MQQRRQKADREYSGGHLATAPLPPSTAHPPGAPSAIAANRFGLGARPGELRSIGGDGREWLHAQLAGPPPAIVGAQLAASADTLARAQELQREIRIARKSGDLERLAAAQKPEHLGVPGHSLADAVFPDSRDAPPLRGLVNA